MNHGISVMELAMPLLAEFYETDAALQTLPAKRQNEHWKADNKFGFFCGVLQYGLEAHTEQIFRLLQERTFAEQQVFTTPLQRYSQRENFTPTLLDEMFDFYISPFHRSQAGSSSNSAETSQGSTSMTSRNPSEENIAGSLWNGDGSASRFKRALSARDQVCLFCWENRHLEGSHIIAQKGNNPVAFDEASILHRAGLSQKHQVANGLLLCKMCHSDFDTLKAYVEVAGDHLAVKVVNDSMDVSNATWKGDVFKLKSHRQTMQVISTDASRSVEDSAGEMALCFHTPNQESLPNRKALEFHKEACLIWRLAGGSELEDLECGSDDEEGVPTPFHAKRIQTWRDSSATLDTESENPYLDQ
jgi:hypothetical protein